MRVLFLGTPDFAVPSLRAINASNHEVIAVITQPDKNGNRNKLTPPAIKVEAEHLGLKVYQFESIRKQAVDLIKTLAPDIIVTAAFGQIISQEILDIPKYGTFNVHGSLLPLYRGASPIQQCLLNGDEVTGVTIMRTELAVDSGDIILQKTLSIETSDNAGTLFDKIAEIGAKAIVEALNLQENGEITFTPQDASKATFCKMVNKADGQLFKDTAVDKAICKIRAYNPWPVAFVMINGARLRIYDASKADAKGTSGSFDVANGKLYLALADGCIEISTLQAEGGKIMSAHDYLLGHSDIKGKEIE